MNPIHYVGSFNACWIVAMLVGAIVMACRKDWQGSRLFVVLTFLWIVISVTKVKGSQEAPTQSELLQTLDHIQRVEAGRDTALASLKTQLATAQRVTTNVQQQADYLAADDLATHSKLAAANNTIIAQSKELARIMWHLHCIIVFVAACASLVIFWRLEGMLVGIPYAVFIEAGVSIALGSLVWFGMDKLFGII